MNIIQQYELKYITCIVIYKYLASVGINLISDFLSHGMATVFLTNFIRCRTSFRMLFPIVLDNELGCANVSEAV